MRTATSFEGVAVPVSALEGVPLFEGLDPDELVAVASRMRLRDFEAQTLICREGEPGASMFVVLEGLADQLAAAPQLPQSPQDRSRSVFAEGRLIGKLRHGDVFGATSLMTGEPRTATVRTATPTTALELGADDFRALIARFPPILSNLTRILSGRLAAATRRQAERGRRGEAVALIVGASLARAVPNVISAARAASVRSLESLDAGPSLGDALARLDEALSEHGTVVLTVALGDEAVPLLLEHVDRAVVLLGEGDGEPGAVVSAAGVPVELVRAGEASARPRNGAGEPRLVRVIAAEAAGLPAHEIAWIGRHLARTKLGLALGAGGAKGYAHVGALQVLEDAGYTIDCVGGSSIGAIVAAYVALGMGAGEIDATLRDAFTEDAVAEVFKLSLAGESTGLDRIARILRETTAERSFDETVIPLVAMAVDLTDGVPAPLTDGPIWQALLASTALAGMFPPHERDGHRLVDGLALVPVPTGAVADQGADLTVSVNLMSRDDLPAWPGQEAPLLEPPKRGSRMLETLLEVMDLSQLDTSIRHAGLADVTLTPRFGPASWRDFHLAELFCAAGRRAAEEQLPALEALARPQSLTVTTK